MKTSSHADACSRESANTPYLIRHNGPSSDPMSSVRLELETADARSVIAELNSHWICEGHGTMLDHAKLLAAAPETKAQRDELRDILRAAVEWADNAPAPYREWSFIVQARAVLTCYQQASTDRGIQGLQYAPDA